MDPSRWVVKTSDIVATETEDASNLLAVELYEGEANLSREAVMSGEGLLSNWVDTEGVRDLLSSGTDALNRSLVAMGLEPVHISLVEGTFEILVASGAAIGFVASVWILGKFAWRCYGSRTFPRPSLMLWRRRSAVEEVRFHS
jgi:hypothetical protein